MAPDESLYRTIVDSLYDGVYAVSPDRTIIYWNQGAERITGFSAREVIGKCCKENILSHVSEYGERLCETGCPIGKTLQDGQARQEEIYLHHKDGHRIPVLVRVSPLRDGHRAITGAVELFSDNSEKTTALQRIADLEEKVFLDPLTGIANRRFMEINLRARLDELRRYGWHFGLLFMDLDQFKKINDTFGHDVGDSALKMVANTLLKNLRSFDLVGRWGGEEFVAIVVNVNEEQLFAVAEKFRRLVQASYLVHGAQTVQVAMSIGATVAKKGDSVKSLLKRVDQLMYQSKKAGGNRVSCTGGPRA